MGSFDFFEETAPRKTAENTAKHRNGGVGSVVANLRGGGESSVVVTTLCPFTKCFFDFSEIWHVGKRSVSDARW